MKIAFCAPVDIHALARHLGQPVEGVSTGLGSTATTPLVITLLGRGHAVTVYTLSKDIHESVFYEWGALRIFVGPARKRRAALNFFKPEIRYLSQIIRQDQPAFLHAHWTYEFALGALATGIPTIVTVHDLPWNVLRHFRDHYRALRLLMAYAVAFRGTQFTAVSTDAANHFRRYFKPGAAIEVVPNGLYESIFDFGNVTVARTGDAFVFATVLQGWSRRKNGTAALRAFHEVRKQLPQAELKMFGTDYGPGGAASVWAEREGLSEGVTFVGNLNYPDLMASLRETDVIVHPSLDESFSMAALEGMALYKPVIAGKSTPGVREVLAFGAAGVLVNVRSPREIAQAMLRLATDRDYAAGMAKAGRERAYAMYRIETVTDQFEALYQRFAGDPAGSERALRATAV